MNRPTEFNRINIIVESALKKALIDRASREGRSLTFILKDLLDKYLKGEIQVGGK